MTTALTIVAAALLGSMLFFPVVVAPLVFKSLPAEHAGQFLRSMFPRYYSWGVVMSAVGLVAALSRPAIDFMILAVVLTGFIVSRQVLMPGINEARDLAMQTKDPSHGQRFKRLHGVSVGINLVQIVLLIGLLWLLASRPVAMPS